MNASLPGVASPLAPGASPRPRLLDLFAGAGGAALGYHRAGFEVVGVDIAPQPHYPFEFHQADALKVLDVLANGDVVRGTRYYWLGGIAAIHASPPCQDYSDMSGCHPELEGAYPRLIGPVRDLLERIGLPWVIENVEGSELAAQGDLFGAHGVLLCGAMFGLQLYRHRLFETSFPVTPLNHPRHLVPASRAGHWEPGTYVSVAGNCAPIELARKAMGGVDWMTREELAESIPPPFATYIGAQLREHLREAA